MLKAIVIVVAILAACLFNIEYASEHHYLKNTAIDEEDLQKLYRVNKQMSIICNTIISIDIIVALFADLTFTMDFVSDLGKLMTVIGIMFVYCVIVKRYLDFNNQIKTID